jgi:hypothetical protein
MGHILYGSVEPQVNKSDDDWYGVAKQVGEFTNKRAARTDIVSVVSTTAGMGAPACFIPSLAEMHINTSVVNMGDPEKVDLTDRLWLLEHAPAVGACTHEAAHARHTHWDPRELMEVYGATRKMIDVITTLEEPRIEAQAIRIHPESRPYLRGCAMEIVGRDFHISDSKYGAATAAGLLLARVDAKVLTAAEARTFRTAIRKVLGDDVLAALKPLWQRFLRLRDRDYEGMVEVAREWLEALDEDPEDTENMAGESMMGEPLPGGAGEGESGESGESEGEGEGSEGEGESKAAKGFGGKIMGKVAEAEVKMDGEIVEAAGDERGERRKAEREADAARKREGEREHKASFGKVSGGLHGYSPDGFAHYIGSRKPTDDERRAAKRLARTLETIDYRDRAVAKVNSMVPPGRLRGRMAVQADALVEKGQDVSGIEVWSGKRRKRVDSTPLTIGFAGDISGSMGAAMEPLSSAQWVLSNAGAHIDAKVAAAHFGDDVQAVTPRGVREKDVRLFYPGGGSEDIKGALLALDRELNLLDGTGARLLFIASDAHYVLAHQMDYAQRFMPLAKRKGVAVIYLNFTGAMALQGVAGAKVLNCVGKSPAEVATMCGKAAVAELRRLDQRV